jgi:hypothetical protein
VYPGASDVTTRLRFAVFTSLWGNKIDLSLWPAGKSDSHAMLASVLKAG